MRVHFIAPWYQTYPILCDALRLQTHQDWTLGLVHDGPWPNEDWGPWIEDDRIGARPTAVRANDWGHSLRAAALASYQGDADYIIVSNHDNYYVPTFLDHMLSAAEGHAGAYCDMIHSHHGYRLIESRLECNWIDCGAIMVAADLAKSTPWTGRHFAADWTWIAALLEKTQDFVHVGLPLFCHN
jgi:hypothetical protein